MEKNNRTYICIDLKSFFASVECVERGLDPLTTRLAVADPTRTEKTICLAITPAMKALGIKNRCRVFQIPKTVDYIMAPPRMQLYIDYAANVYEVYLKYIAKEDIHVYSIDEVFMDVTDYLTMYQMTPKELGIKIMEDVYQTTGITATCGIGTNMYLAKIALDITAKHVKDHIGILDEKSYCETLWDHKPITDFWRVGEGIKKRLLSLGLQTMKDVANADENILYKVFGIDAELLIDHAWGRETATIQDIKNYKPSVHSLSNGQILPENYSFEEARLVVREMVDSLALDLVDSDLISDSITLDIFYDRHLNVKHAHGTKTFPTATSAATRLKASAMELYDQIVRRDLPIRQIAVSFNRVVDAAYFQYDIFTDPQELMRENKMQKAMIDIKKRYGKNAILKGMNLEKKGTMRERNEQIGGHKAGSDINGNSE